MPFQSSVVTGYATHEAMSSSVYHLALFLVASSSLHISQAQLLHATEEPPQPPLPYSFSYAAGRAPGHVDRVHSETSDGSGVVRGQFSYVDPRSKVRTVDYVADAHGFHAQLSHPVQDTPTVAAAKLRHHDLFARIAADHARIAAERAQNNPEDPHLL